MRLIWGLLLLAAGTLPAGAAVVYVDARVPGPVHDGLSWATAFTAIPPGSPGWEVWVAAGVYNPLTQPVPGTRFYGGFQGSETARDQRDPARNVTVLDGRGTARAASFPPTAKADTVLDGFTLRNVFSQSATVGGGLVCYGSPTLRNLVITGLDILPPSAAIHCARGAAPLIEGCLIAENGSDGIACAEGSSPTVRDCVIRGNQGFGLTAYKATLAISGCQIIGNRDAGIDASQCALAVQGNTVRGSAGRAIAAWGCTGAIAGNRVCGNASGIGVSGDGLVVASNLVADNRSVLGGSGGITCGSGSPLIVGNTIVGNGGSPDSGGIYLVSEFGGPAATPVIANNIIAFNDAGVVNGYNPGAPILRGNCAFGNPGGDYVGLPDPTGRDRNIRVDPRFALPATLDFHIQPDSPCRDAADPAFSVELPDLDGQPRLQGAAMDIGADESDGAPRPTQPPVIRVSPSGDDAHDGSSWETAKRRIQAALDAVQALGGGEVWAAAGTYPERLTVGPGTRLLGGFSDGSPASGGTLIDAGGLGTALTVAPGATRVQVERLSLVNGRSPRGAGLLCGYGSVVELRGAAISGCTAASASAEEPSRGGGAYVESASLSLRGCSLAGNTANSGAGVSAALSALTIDGCSLAWNTAVPESGTGGLGGGLASSFGGLTVTDSLFAHNAADDGAGAYLNYALTPDSTVSRCSFLDNAAGAAGGGLSFVIAGPGMRVASCLFARNTAGLRGGGLMTGVSGPMVVNNTFAANQAPEGGAVWVPLHLAGFSGNIVAGNSSGVGADPNYAYATWRGAFNCFFANPGGSYTGPSAPFGGNGNIAADPLFANPAAGDYRLRLASPCIDAADDAAVLPGETDLDGRPRWSGRHPDIGAYESAFTAPLRWPDAYRSLRLAAGLAPSSPADAPLDADASGRIDLPDALRLIRTLQAQ